MDDWSGNADGLKTRIEALSGVTEAQQKKVELLKEKYKEVAEEKGKNSKAAQDLEIYLNNETKKLNENKKELDDVNGKLKNFTQETDSAGDKTKKFDGLLDGLKTSLKNMGSVAADAAVTSIKAVSAAAIGAAAGAFKLATDAGEAADELLTLSAKTGISTQKLQEMQYASRFVDVELETMTGSMNKLTKNMDSARNGSEGAQNAFKALNINITDQNGQLRDSKVVWEETIGALGNVKNETERNALAMKIFGKSATELNPLIKAGTDELNRLGVEANKVGAVLSDESVMNAGKFDDMMQTLQASSKGLAMNLGVAVMPAISSVVSEAQAMIPKVIEAIKTGDWNSAGTALSQGVNNVLGGITKSLPGLLTVGTEIISGIAKTIAEAVPQVLPAVIDSAVTLINTIVKIWKDNGPNLIKTGVEALMTLIKGLSDTIPDLVSAATDIFLSFIDTLMANLPKLVDTAISIILKLALGLIDALPKLIKEIPKIIEGIVNTLSDNLPKIMDAAAKIIVALAKAIITNLPEILQAAVEIMGSLLKGLLNGIKGILSFVPKLFSEIGKALGEVKWIQLGKDIISGIASGIAAAASSIAEGVVKAAKGALDAAKKALGIESPSRVFKNEVGTQIGAGMAEGISGSEDLVKNATTKVSKSITAIDISNGFGKKINDSIKGANFGLINNLAADVYSSSKSVGNAIVIAERNSGVDNTNSFSDSREAPGRKLVINIENNGTVVGSNGMKEFAQIVSNEIGMKLGLSQGGEF